MTEVPAEIAEQLYAAEPHLFVAGRDAAVAAARAAGDTRGAAAIAALRRPTVAAWLVNLLAIRRPAQLDRLVELSTALRTAQRELRGEQLRRLSARRQPVIAELTAQARELALAAQPALVAAKLPLDEVAATLTAALADAGVAAQVRSGRLVKAVSYSGFGDVPPSSTSADSASAGATTSARAAGVKRLQRELVAARAAEATAREQVTVAAAAERAAAADLDAVEEALAELTDRRVRAKQESEHRRAAHTEARRRLAAAGRRVGEVEAWLEERVEGQAGE